MRKIQKRAEQAAAYAHEIFHWLAALALGLPASIVVNPRKRFAYTKVDVEHEWQELLIALAPALAGLAIMVWIVGLDSASSWMLLILWQIGCWYDFVQVWQMAKDALSA